MNYLNPEHYRPAEHEELVLYFHLCPARVRAFLRRNNVVMPPIEEKEACTVLLTLLNLGLRMGFNIKTPRGTTIARAIQLVRDGRVIDQEAV